MKSHAEVVVIGGGLVGCSILYHLAKIGCKNIVLLERNELTSGSTWHAAAGIHGLHDNNNITQIQHYTMRLYKQLEEQTGQGCGVFQPGSLYLAQTKEREQQLKLQEAKAKYYNLNFYEVSHEEAQKLHPLAKFYDVRCIMFEPEGGNVDPSGVTHAYALGARNLGAEIERFCPVIAIEKTSNQNWKIITPKGDIITKWIVNSAGLWAREVGEMVGLKLPLLPTEHQYLVTELIPEIKSLKKRLPSIADRDNEYYLRQEGKGLLVGAYEKDMKFWAEDKTPQDFGHELFNEDLNRIMDNVICAIERVPILKTTGVKRVINGPMIWSPDSSALFGPVPELENYFCCAGIIPGFSQSGGLGLLAAQWIVKGETDFDMFSWDLARFGDWADKNFTKARVHDQYVNRFKIQFPNEERIAGRPVRKRPVYEFQKQMGAVFGINAGWEHPLWFAKEQGVEETIGFSRQNWFEPVNKEVEMLRKFVGIIDISNFANYIITGPDAANWLNSLVANHIPKEVGKTCLTPLLSLKGGIAGDFTITKIHDNKFMMVGSGMAERYHQRFFNMIKISKDTSFKNVTNEIVGFNIAGPKSRSLMQSIISENLTDSAWPFMQSKNVDVSGIECIAIRVSFTGDIGWELHCNECHQFDLYKILIDASKAFNGGAVGSRALTSLRIEKGYGSWGREYSQEYWPQEAGLENLIKLDKDFLNKDAYLKIKDLAPKVILTMFEVEVTDDADANGGEPIFLIDNTPIGYVTSGAYGSFVNKSLAIGYIKNGSASPGDDVKIYILGKAHNAKILNAPPF